MRSTGVLVHHAPSHLTPTLPLPPLPRVPLTPLPLARTCLVPALPLPGLSFHLTMRRTVMKMVVTCFLHFLESSVWPPMVGLMNH